MVEGRLYDGVTGHPHAVTVTFEPAAIQLGQSSGWSDAVEADELCRYDPAPDTLRLGRKGQPGWRLLLPLDSAPELQTLLGKEERYGRWVDRVGLVPALIVGAIVTAAVVGLGYVAPHWIAPHVPMRWERNVGGAIVGDFGDLRCRNADGQKALEALVERVAPGATQGAYGIRIAALNVGVFNAAALPGNYVVVFKPAITETNPDALAGVLAHEVAHVRRRHVTEALLRELGIGALIRTFAGNFGANAEQIISLSYTRDNEAQADGDAIAMLRQAHISPRPTAALFAHLAKEQGDGDDRFGAEFLRSHPLSAGRAQRFAASFDPRATYQPALSPEQWKALVNICPDRR